MPLYFTIPIVVMLNCVAVIFICCAVAVVVGLVFFIKEKIDEVWYE